MNTLKSSRSRIALALYVLIITLLTGGTAIAQTGSSTIRGTVTDPQGNAVAGATVTLSNPGKNFTRTARRQRRGRLCLLARPARHLRSKRGHRLQKSVAKTDGAR